MLKRLSSTKSSFIEIIGQGALNLGQAFMYISQNRVPVDQFLSRIVFLGYESLPMILILSSVATMILTINTSIELSNQGGRELIGALIAVADLREIVPIFISFALAARCGTSLTAEIASMKVTDQIDVLRVLKIDPLYYILTPVIYAVIVIVPFLLAIASISSIVTGMLVSRVIVNLEFADFLDSAWNAIGLKEYFYPLIKTLCFSVYALLINVSLGLACQGGAKEVGETTTRATALVIVGIVVLDGILTPILY